MKPTVFNHIIDYPPLCNVHGECSKWVIEWLYIGGYFNYIQHTSAATSFLCIWHCVISYKSLNAVNVLKECCVHIFLTAPRRWPSVWFTLCFRLPWVYPSASESEFILFSRFLPEFYTYSFHIKNLGHMGCSADLIYFRAKITSPDITLFSSFLFSSFIPRPIILKT